MRNLTWVFLLFTASCSVAQLQSDDSTYFLSQLNGRTRNFSDMSQNGLTVVDSGAVADTAYPVANNNYGSYRFKSNPLTCIKISGGETSTLPVKIGYQATVEFWVYIDSIPNNGPIPSFISQTATATAYKPAVRFSLCEKSDELGRLLPGYAIAYDAAGPYGNSYTSPATTEIVLKKWLHIALTWDSGVLIFYINGKYFVQSPNTLYAYVYYNPKAGISQFVYGFPVIWDGVQPVRIGYGLSGKMCELKMYNKILSPLEILADYQKVLSPTKTEMPQARTGGGLSVCANPSKTPVIRFNIPNSVPTVLNIYDLSGRLLSTPFNELAQGLHSVAWNGAKYANGVYIAVLQTGETKQTAKVLLQR